MPGAKLLWLEEIPPLKGLVMELKPDWDADAEAAKRRR